jgi:hypothetical protein
VTREVAGPTAMPGQDEELEEDEDEIEDEG